MPSREITDSKYHHGTPPPVVSCARLATIFSALRAAPLSPSQLVSATGLALRHDISNLKVGGGGGSLDELKRQSLLIADDAKLFAPRREWNLLQLAPRTVWQLVLNI